MPSLPLLQFLCSPPPSTPVPSPALNMASSRRGVALLLRGAAAALQRAGGRQSQLLAAVSSSEACSTSSIWTACSASRTQPALHRGFAASAADSLAEILKAESTFEKGDYQRPAEVAGGPPAPFKLEESPGDTLLTLSRSFGAETVKIDLHVNNQPSPPYEGEDGEEADDEKLTSVVFNVAVTKGDKSLVFECESDGNSVTISHVSFEPKVGCDDGDGGWAEQQRKGQAAAHVVTHVHTPHARHDLQGAHMGHSGQPTPCIASCPAAAGRQAEGGRDRPTSPTSPAVLIAGWLRFREHVHGARV